MDSLYRYAGIGSRQTPEPVQRLMQVIALTLNTRFYLLTGDAYGADRAFSSALNKHYHIFTARDILQNRYGNAKEALQLAGHVHPAWGKCSNYARALLARDCYQVLGSNLKSPVDFIICWTRNGELVGGTAQALRIAEIFKIPVINLGKETVLHNVVQSLKVGSFENKILSWLAARK